MAGAKLSHKVKGPKRGTKSQKRFPTSTSLIFKFNKNQTLCQFAWHQNFKIQNWKSNKETGKGEARKVWWGGEILAKADLFAK